MNKECQDARELDYIRQASKNEEGRFARELAIRCLIFIDGYAFLRSQGVRMDDLRRRLAQEVKDVLDRPPRHDVDGVS